MTDVRSFAEAVRRRAERDPDSEVVRSVGGSGWSAATLHERASAIAHGLAGVVSPGDTVATAISSSPEAIAITAALSTLGAVELALPDRVDPAWARRLSADAGCVLTVADPARVADEPVLTELVNRRSPGTVLTRATTVDLDEGTVLLDELVSEPTPLPRHRPSLGTPALVMPTSGTTGRPKGALLPNGAALGQAARVQRAMGYTPDDVLANYFPWQHINARHASFLSALMSGARLVVGHFSVSTFWRTAVEEKVTAFNFMGALCALLLRQPDGPLDRSHAVTRAYGGPAPAWMVFEMAQRFDVQLRQAYACTELADVAVTGPRIRPGSAGRPVSEYDVEVRGEDGVPVPAGEVGQLVVRPRERHLTFTEYVGDAEASAAAWQDGWFRTGDRARIDDGWLYFEGRGSDVIRRRGVNISATTVEDAVAALPGVAEVAAIGVPSELTEDDVLLVVVPAPGAQVDAAAVHQRCQDVLPRHAVPRYVSIEQELPRNDSLKLLRGRLRERGLPLAAWDAETTGATAGPRR